MYPVRCLHGVPCMLCAAGRFDVRASRHARLKFLAALPPPPLRSSGPLCMPWPTWFGPLLQEGVRAFGLWAGRCPACPPIPVCPVCPGCACPACPGAPVQPIASAPCTEPVGSDLVTLGCLCFGCLVLGLCLGLVLARLGRRIVPAADGRADPAWDEVGLRSLRHRRAAALAPAAHSRTTGAFAGVIGD